MEKKQGFKNDILVCLLIGLCFLLTGAEYITWWLYRLVLAVDSSTSDLLSEGIGYLFQVIGLLIYSFIAKRKAEFLNKAFFLPLCIIIDLLLCAAAFSSSFTAVIIAAGFAMNFFHGIIAGHYLTKLAIFASKKHTAIVFGGGYAFGTLITYVLSNVLEGALGSSYVFLIYIALGLCASVVDYILLRDNKNYSVETNISTFAEDAYDSKQIAYAIIIVFLFSFIKNIGFYFPTDDIVTGAIDPILIRCIYAVGLVLAGIINDKSRRYGSVCCLCALVFPFLVLALKGITLAGVVAWVLGYVFFGFFSVYRVTVFSDISRSNTSLIYIAGWGLMFGRIGDSTSAIAGILIGERTNILILVTTILFIANIFLFFKFYNQVYVTVIPRIKNQSDIFGEFLAYYDISQREREVLRQVLDGLSNSEIAAKLYISESTVKFHVHNILKKTKSANRIELMDTYHKFAE